MYSVTCLVFLLFATVFNSRKSHCDVQSEAKVSS